MAVSSGKKFFATVLLTFIVLIVVGAAYSGKGGDAAGTKTGGTADYVNLATQQPVLTQPDGSVPLSQVGINQLASQVGHVGVSVNFTWLLMTGFLVLFMQVGFAFLVTGLTREKTRAT